MAFVGRMTDLKGGSLLVEAVAQASARLQTPIRLLLVGDGPRRAAWVQRAAKLGVPCTAPGWLQDEDKSHALRDATLLAVPSTWPEPFGLVGLEAAALGLHGGSGSTSAASASGSVRASTDISCPPIRHGPVPLPTPSCACCRILKNCARWVRCGHGGRRNVARAPSGSAGVDLRATQPAACGFFWC